MPENCPIANLNTIESSNAVAYNINYNTLHARELSNCEISNVQLHSEIIHVVTDGFQCQDPIPRFLKNVGVHENYKFMVGVLA